MTAAGTSTISGIELITNSAAIIAVTGSAASILNLNNCYLNCTNNTGITFSAANTAAKINLYCCQGDLGTTGISYGTMSSTGLMLFQYCFLTNTGASTTALTNSAGEIDFHFTKIHCPLSTSGTGLMELRYCWVECAALNTLAVTLNGTGGQSNIFMSSISSGSASALSIGTGASSAIGLTKITSNNTNCITGAGTIAQAALTFDGSSSTINTTTQQGGAIQGGRGTFAPPGGFIGEQIRTTVAGAGTVITSSNVAQNIGSISLTAGIWDVSLNSLMNGTATVTQFITGISTTSATQGTDGDATTQTPVNSNGAANVGLCVPAFRITLSATTTVYWVTTVVFSAGTPRNYGRMSATRVG
jgi:hypothetical protein